MPMTQDEIEKEIEAFLRTWPDAAYGPAHIVLSDRNLDPSNILWAQGVLFAVRYIRKNADFYEIHSDSELEATERFLYWLQGKGSPRLRLKPRPGGCEIIEERWQDVAREEI
jgi:hypothetical protein